MITEKEKEYYIKNRKRILRQRKLYHENNAEKVKEWGNRYRKDNKEKISEKNEKWRTEHNNKEYMKQYRIDHKERIARLSKIRYDRWLEKNKEKNSLYMKEYRKNHRKVKEYIKYCGLTYDYVIEYNKKYNILHDDKYNKWVLLKADIIIRDNFTCQMCKQYFNYNLQALTAHHIVPRKENGSDDPRNLITLCGHCHDIAELNNLSFRQIIDYYKIYPVIS